MSTITKERNILVIIGDKTNRRYTFDINTGILYGCSGKALKTKPTEAVKVSTGDSPIFTIYHFLMERCTTAQISASERFKKLLSFADTLTSLGYSTDDISKWEIQYFSDAIIEEEATLKEVLKYCKEVKENGNRIVYNEYVALKCREKMAQTLKPYDLTDTEKDLIQFILRRKTVEIKVPALVSYLKFLMPFYNNDYYAIERKLMEYICMCKDLNWEPKKGDFASLYIQTKLTFELNKQKIESEKLERNQPKTLFFEDENFTVIIPITSEAFKLEAEAQSNCVYRSYLSEVMKGYTNIVFIRKKSDVDTSYITCEVRDGRIVQYLGRYNNYVHDEEALAFRTKYQAYLNTVQF